MSTINLGRKASEAGLLQPCCTKEAPEDRTIYPEAHYEGPEDLGIPEKGTMVVEYEIVRKSESKDNGREHYSCTIQLQEIKSVKGESDDRPARSYSQAAEALDALMEAAEKVEGEDED
jgi:hypothetical protein